jgi:hypothetical protein
MASTTMEAQLRSTDPMASARWVRRAVSCSAPSPRAVARSRRARRIEGSGPTAVVSVSRRIARCARYRTTTAITTMSRIRAGVAIRARAFSASHSAPDHS